ncbi:MAG: hypothetical protein ACE363_00245 [Alphaproteobacteria bacterium]
MDALKPLKTVTLAAMLAAGSLTLVACEDKSPMEQAAEDMEDAAEDMKDSMEDAADDLSN